MRLALGEHPVDLVVDLGGSGFEVGAVLQAQADEQSMVISEPASQSLAKLGDLFPQPALGQLGQHLRIAFPGDQGGQHRSAGTVA